MKADPALSDVPVLLLCGNSQPYDADKGRSACADGHLVKPWDTQQLLDRLAEVFDRDLLEEGREVLVVRDAVCSRVRKNFETGLRLMERAGAAITTMETVVFDLLGRAGTDDFKAISRLVR